MPTWLVGVQKLAVTYPTPQGPMNNPILGVVLHTTNAGPTVNTLELFKATWQSNIDSPNIPAALKVTAHFMVDRNGNVGQFRSLEEVAWHIGGLSRRYIGIEHIAAWKEDVAIDQFQASAVLIARLSDMFCFPVSAINKPGEKGIGFHKQFGGTSCGEDVFCAVGPRVRALDRFWKIIDAASTSSLHGKNQDCDP
jgi:hypothetical protein